MLPVQIILCKRIKNVGIFNCMQFHKGYFFIIAATEDITTLRSEVHKMGLPEEYFEDIMMEMDDSREDVREMTIYTMLQRAIYNRLNKDMTDYNKRMDIILADLKDEFRDQIV